MPSLESNLELERCPHCNVDKPNLSAIGNYETTTHNGTNKRHWKIYRCSRCGGLVTASSRNPSGQLLQIFPSVTDVHESIPSPAREYLRQALNSLHAPAGAIMLAASSVDAMLKEKKYKEGSLYSRINKAAEDHLITKEMAKWAHEVRLDANEQRHADDSISLPKEDDARRCIDFVIALGSFMFVLPDRVKKGLKDAKQASHQTDEPREDNSQK